MRTDVRLAVFSIMSILLILCVASKVSMASDTQPSPDNNTVYFHGTRNPPPDTRYIDVWMNADKDDVNSSSSITWLTGSLPLFVHHQPEIESTIILNVSNTIYVYLVLSGVFQELYNVNFQLYKIHNMNHINITELTLLTKESDGSFTGELDIIINTISDGDGFATVIYLPSETEITFTMGGESFFILPFEGRNDPDDPHDPDTPTDNTNQTGDGGDQTPDGDGNERESGDDGITSSGGLNYLLLGVVLVVVIVVLAVVLSKR